MGRIVAWMGVAVGAVYLIYIGGGWWGIYSPWLRIATMGMAGLALVAWAWVARRNPEWRPRTVLWPAILAVLGSLTISTIFSRIPRISLEYLGYTVVLVALYLLLVRLFANPFFRRRLATLAAMLFVVSAGAYIATVVGGWIEWWGLVGGIGVPPLRPGFTGLTYNNPSAALTMITLLGVPTVATFGSTTRRGLAVIVGVVAVVGFVALVSGSRAGWLALGATAVIAPIAWLSSRSNRELARTATAGLFARRAGRVGVAVVLLVLAGLAVVLAPAILRRALEGGQDLRITYSVTAIRMFLESPVVGTGPGTWVIQRPHYTIAPEPDYYIPHTHNLESQTLAELGLVGVVAAVVVVVLLVRLFAGAIRGEDRARRWWGWTGAIALVYFVLHQVLDFYVNMPAFLFAAAIPIAYLDATAPSAGWAPVLPAGLVGRAARGIAMAAVALWVVGLLVQEYPAKKQAQAVDAANARDWATANVLARAPADLDPDVGSYTFTAGLAAAHEGDHAAALRSFERVVVLNDLPEAWLNLAAERAEAGNTQGALDAIRSALRLGYQRPVVAMPAGDLALRLGDTELAVDAFAAALAVAPSLAGDPWWRSDPSREAVRQAAIDHALTIKPFNRWELTLESGDEAGAFAMVAGDPYLASITRAWFGDPAALADVRTTCAERSLDLGSLSWCARVERHLGNEEAADDFQKMTNLINAGAGFDTGELRVSETGMVGRQLPGVPADLWATYTFRRPAPWDILVPSLIHLTLE